MKKTLFLLVILACTTSAYSQNLKNTERGYDHELILNFGGTYVPEASGEILGNEEGRAFLAIGLDYFVRWHDRIKAGVMLDLELDRYYIPRSNELERDFATMVIPAINYSVLEELSIIVGGGLEFDDNKTFFVTRFGTEYVVQFNNGWGLAPGAYFDLKEGYWSTTLGIGIVKSF